jgi:hypothetical protein
MNSLGKISTPLIKLGESKSFTIFGKSFLKVTAVYLSGHPYENTTFYNPFSAIPKLSAQNPGFYALKLGPSQYQINANRSFTINVPPPTRLGNIDVLLQNEAGWGNLSRFVITNTINPYPVGHPLRNSWTPYEKPWKDGILVTF